MKLQPGWRYGKHGGLDFPVVHAFSDLIGRVASQGNRWSILEHFKGHYAGAAGRPYSSSSSGDWAASDLDDYMRQAADHAPLFIEAFVDGCQKLGQSNAALELPGASVVNAILHRHGTGYEIQGDELVRVGHDVHVPTVVVSSSLDEQAQEIIRKSFDDANRLLSEGSDRPAVQELLWLLETVSTAFAGMGDGDQTVTGRYFNEIARSLRLRQRGTVLEQALAWITTMHGYLSSPTGGGVRHGRDLSSGIPMGRNDAVLIANLTRSYINFLIAEHDRINAALLGPHS